MTVAFETVIIVIVVVSFTVLAAVVVALYWLWRLLLEDRRCALVNGTSSLGWNGRSAIPGFAVILSGRAPPSRSCVDTIDEDAERLTTDHSSERPQVTRGNVVMVDERSFRMTRSKVPTTPQKQKPPAPAPQEVVVLDGTEPPPPYDGT